MNEDGNGTIVLTPTVGQRAKRSVFWIAAGLFTLLVALAALALAGSTAADDRLAGDNPAPGGAKALLSVLREQGIDVRETHSLDESSKASEDPTATTIAIYDPEALLTQSQWEAAATLGATVVLIDPGFDALHALAPDVANAGDVSGPVDAGCDSPLTRHAEQISADGSAYRIVTPSDSVRTCYASYGDTYSLVTVDATSGTIVVLGATDAVTNEFIADRSNAALALTVFGQTDRLIWYLPSIDDLSARAPTAGELTPPWVIPAIAMFAIAAVAAALWRGRRFGPLVVENLPVTVRSSETMEGRARLYESASARSRAIDALRVASLERIAAECGLSRLAKVDDVVNAAAATTGAPVEVVRRVLVDALPETDRQLLSLSDDLTRLEAAVREAVTPNS